MDHLHLIDLNTPSLTVLFGNSALSYLNSAVHSKVRYSQF